MKLKTYRATSMAQALVEVRRDLGPDAVILHTRAYRIGSLLGIGGRSMVEVTASTRSGAPGTNGAARNGPQSASRQTVRPTPSGTYAAVPAMPQVSPPERGDPPRVVVPSGIELPTPVRAESRAAAPGRPDHLEGEIAELKRMVGQVLQSSRQTAVAVGQGQAFTPGASTGPLFDAYARLIEQDVDADIAEELAAKVRDELNAEERADARIVRETMLRRLAELIPVRHDRPASGAGRTAPRRVALIGPTGVGKTTTVAKLAASYKLRYGLSVGLVTIDTYRIAAVEQLRTYASIIGLPIQVVNTPEEMRAAIAELRECEAVFIDTAGRSHNDAARLGELGEFVKAAEPDETHLVLSSTATASTLARIAERFAPLGPDRCILTKLDEAVTFGVVAGLCRRTGLPLSFVTTGQEVPDHIEPARPERLARLVLDGPKGDQGGTAP